MPILLLVLASTLLVSLLSLIGAFVLALKEKTLNKIVNFLVDLSVGVLMAVALLDLVPDAIEKFGPENIFLYLLTGFFLFFLIEKLLHWRHCHDEHCEVHNFAYINLLGESVHNLTDGLIIGAAFVASVPLGFATVFAVVLHEIPHEMGNFGVLIYAGFQKKKALMFNFLTGLTAVIGGAVGYYLSSYVGLTANFLLPFAAGGFIYIAASDLIPEGRKERNIKKSVAGFAIAVIGVLIIYSIKIYFPE
ncbi:MAG: ZIP family metal transporter [Candidatus Staskawiczbacteria bacterium]|jgi:zinc and cadmium transporter